MKHSKIDLNHFKLVLENRRTELEQNINQLNNDLNNLKSLETIEDGDFASISSDSYTNNIIISQQTKELQEIQYSLNKIDNESEQFGICEMCEDEILKARLEAKPFAIYCKICRELAEKSENLKNRRK